ncbi:MAG: RagB/SusD family nutrient uptake outer membrane protein [Odoribacteraceae bacterium]|jgi:hypothetical protein|nr:RagB/SusD family nutrient uptake outer membrane protein [Odoribacteraceae bacterium]
MKTLYTFIFAAFLLVACNDWLDVSPAGEIKASDMYRDEEGFQGVLAGVYVAMADPALYGRTMTMQLPELLVRHWDVSTDASLEGYLRDYRFEQSIVKNHITNTWRAYYNAIVSLNSLLGAIDEKKEIFTAGNYNLVKGEALGLRAFLHFDVLRLWGPVPVNADTSAIAIPYVREVTRDVDKLVSISYGRVLRAIIDDLDAAGELLADDPIKRYHSSILNSGSNGPDNEFWYFRQNRFNYLAVQATKARYYQWIGHHDLAVTHARAVIEATISGSSTRVFELATERTVGGDIDVDADLTMGVEHIFAVHNAHLLSNIESFFFLGNCKQELTTIDEAWEKTAHSNDIRNKPNRYWEIFQAVKQQAVFKKYYDPDAKTAATVVPLIRLAEMYFIVMAHGPLDEANRLLVDFRVARVMDLSIDNSLVTPADVHSRLEREYRKEFFCEGQMFYFYKRLGQPNLTWPVIVENVPYQLPKPEQQANFE